ncbi:MAG: hypothetical protein Q7T45_22655 [Bradyrhizobium sp.]|uniref:hypothetical protein n=1 Tax=Bradyrhizobium sp. TaxID=376 RepID=UPI0027163195|nr:hypothetical protein [Bradyrhizobium sp.]MDO8400622.1 hypothetical protein [Bradyrhizobium sp.]
MKKPAKTKAKGKAKAANRKGAKRKPIEQVTPTFLKEGLSIRMGLHDVIKVVKMIEKAGHLGKFTSRVKREEAQVTVPADTVNLVKDFVAKNGMHGSATGKHIVNGRGRPAGGPKPRTTMAGAAGASLTASNKDPNTCEFGTVGHG